MTSDQADLLISEIQSVKKLMMLQLLAIGYKQKQIATVLGVSEATLSRMLPKGLAKDLARGTNTEE